MTKPRARILAGKKSPGKRYRHVPLNQLVGRTVQAVATTEVDSALGREPCVVLYFRDGSQHGFVLPAEWR